MAVATKVTPEQIGGMAYKELVAELGNHFAAAGEIEKKYPDGNITSAEDAAEVKTILARVDAMEDRLSGLEDPEARKQRILAGQKTYAGVNSNHVHPETPEARSFAQFLKSPGKQFTDSPAFKALVESGVLSSSMPVPSIGVQLKDGPSLLDYKTLVTSATGSAGSLVANDYRGFKVPMLAREMSLLDLIPRGRTGSDTVEYVEETTWTRAATTVAEATGFTATTLGGTGIKPESAFAYTTRTSSVQTIATWTPITTRMLADYPQVESLIDNRLLMDLDLTMESLVATGAGTGTDFTGLTNASGINVQGKGTDSNQDAIFKGAQLVRTTGLSRPSAIAISPTDFALIRLARENAATATFGGYLMGPPSQGGFLTLWGLPVVQTLALPAGTALVGDFQQCMLFDREQATVRTGYVNDQFIRNMLTLLAELRAAFAIWRGAAFAKVTGLA